MLLANFGGPRNLEEIEPFLIELLTDGDVVRTRFPRLFEKWLFTRIAKKRVNKVLGDYEKMGGASPIFGDTECLAKALNAFTFHRYLPATHTASLAAIENFPGNTLDVFPLFPQFSFATTGSIARFFEEQLSQTACRKLRWVASYHDHPEFISIYVNHIHTFLKSENIDESDTIFIFSAHGLPISYVIEGDPYQIQCETSYRLIADHFPAARHHLCYQSQFGSQPWLKPATDTLCKSLTGKGTVVFIPLSFTSDHVETLVEVEEEYLPIVEKAGFTAHRCPAFNTDPQWIETIGKILNDTSRLTNDQLIRCSSARAVLSSSCEECPTQSALCTLCQAPYGKPSEGACCLNDRIG